MDEIKEEIKEETIIEEKTEIIDEAEEKKKAVYKISFAGIIRRFVTSWLFAAIVMYMFLPLESRALSGVEGLTDMNGYIGIIVGAALFIVLMLYPFLLGEDVYFERLMLLGAFVLLGTISLMNSFSAPFLAIILIVTALLLFYMDFGWYSGDISIKEKATGKDMAPKVAVFIGIAFFLFLASWMSARVRTHSTPTYDYGIFAQMFYSMRTHGTMVTTLERAETMSHLCVHVSFIYYLLLPLFFLFPSVSFLNALQGLVMASAFIPLWKLARSFKLSKWESVAVVALLAVYPAYAAGASYDLHENIFLTPLMLWLFYAMRKKSIWGTAVSTILVLLVKEDAPVYTAVIALFFIVAELLKKRYKSFEFLAGVSIFLGSVIYFVVVTTFLATYGDGVMSGRYNNFIFDESGSLVTVIKSVLLEPMKVLYESVDKEKIAYMGYTIVALAGIPLFTRRYERFILLIPYFLLNLMPDYGYQHSIYSQYGFGVTACFMYLVIVNVTDMKKLFGRKHKAKIWLVLATPLVISTVLFWKTSVPKCMTYLERYQEKQSIYIARETIMDKIPDDSSVAASTFFTTYLSQRDEIYDIKHSEKDKIFSVDYILADYGETDCYKRYITEDNDNGYECFVKQLTEHGYVMSSISGYGLDIYVKSE